MIRAILGALIGAAAAAAALLAFSLLDPAIALEMNGDVPRPLANGLYPVETAGDETYAWTSPLTTFTFRDLNRASAWRCSARLRGARPPGVPEATITVAVDGVVLSSRVAGPQYEDVEIVVPPRDANGLRLSLSTTPPFVPASDPRQLGVQLDRLECHPDGAGWVFPPRGALIAAAVPGAVFGGLFAILAPMTTAGVASLLFAVAIAWVIQTGLAPFTARYLAWIPVSALWIGAPAMALAALRSRRMSAPARFVVGFSAAVLFLKLAALMHPSKAIVDAVFHAHRLEWVLDGRYFFTQPMPGGVQFPYAIALYVTAAPLATILSDHVALLRIVVCSFEVLAAALLYVVVVRAWGERLAGAFAVVLYHLVPLPYAVIGNANLTYAFGHAISVLAFVTVSVLAFRGRNVTSLAVLLLTATTAFLSHVAVFPLLAVALVLTGGLYAFSRDVDLRRYGWTVIGLTVAAALVAFGVYYAHFPEVYRTLDRVSSASPDASATMPQAPSPAALPFSSRATRAVTLGLRDVGLPVSVLAGVGLWLRLAVRGDRLNRVLVGWGAAFMLFVAFRIVAPVDPRLQRYADEFIDRVYYATLPAIVILAAWTAATGWTSGGAWRLLASLLAAAAAFVGVTAWAEWIR